MAAALTPSSTLSGIARALVQAGRVTSGEAEALMSQAKTAHVSFIEQMIASKKMSARDIAQFASETFGYPLLDIDTFDQAQMLKTAIDRKIFVPGQ